jgi:hypothetical protein
VRNTVFLEFSPSRPPGGGGKGHILRLFRARSRKTAQSAARVTIIVSQRRCGLKLLAGETRQRVKCPSQLKERGLYVGETA